MPASNNVGVNKTSLKNNGFTLIELMVVVAIIAILSVVGIAVYSGVQQNARDARRMSDIDAMANAMEVHYDGATGLYADFDPATFMSGGSTPEDPLADSARCGTSNNRICNYCGRSTAGTAMTKGENSTSGCTSGGSKIGADVPVSDTAFEICTTLENRSPRYYCRSNQR